jgi:hypothetical protein
MSESLQLLIDRVNTPSVRWSSSRIMTEIFTLLTGQITQRECCVYCGVTMANGFKLEPAQKPHGFADIIKRYFAGDLSALDALAVGPVGN